MAGIVAPQIARANGQSPVRRARHSVWPVQHANNAVHACRGRAVALSFRAAHATPPDCAGKALPLKSEALWAQHHIVWRLHPFKNTSWDEQGTVLLAARLLDRGAQRREISSKDMS